MADKFGIFCHLYFAYFILVEHVWNLFRTKRCEIDSGYDKALTSSSLSSLFRISVPASLQNSIPSVIYSFLH